MREVDEATEGTEGINTKKVSRAFLLVDSGEGVRRLIESEAAKIVAKRLRRKLAYELGSKKFLIWAGTHWRITHDTDEAIALVASVVDEGCGTSGYHQGYLNAIFRQIQITGALQRSRNPRCIVPFRNGLLDINSGEIKPATPSHSTDWVLPHNYEMSAECENIKKWLLDAVDGDRDTFNLLRAWFAALVRGLPIQCVLMLIGRGGSGKGVFQRLAVETIGERNTATSTLSSLEGNRFEPAKHYGKSLCLINEAGRFRGQLNMLKAMSGRDHIPLEIKHRQQTGSFVYGGLFMLATNDDIASSDSGIERRRIAIRFSKLVTVEERKDWQERGGEEVILHSEIPGLIRWVLEMPISDIHRAFEHLPARVVEENLLGMRAGSSVADWMVSECFLGPEVENQMGSYKGEEENDEHLYPAYRCWCKQNGREPVASNIFKNRLFEAASRLGHQLKDSKDSVKRQIVIAGICLNSVQSKLEKVPSVASVPSNPKSLEGTEATFLKKHSDEDQAWIDDFDNAGNQSVAS